MKIVMTIDVPARHEEYVRDLNRDGDAVALREWSDNYGYDYDVRVVD